MPKAEGKGAVAKTAAPGSAVGSSGPSDARPPRPLLAAPANPTSHTSAASARRSPFRNFLAGHNWLQTRRASVRQECLTSRGRRLGRGGKVS